MNNMSFWFLVSLASPPIQGQFLWELPTKQKVVKKPKTNGKKIKKQGTPAGSVV